MRHRAGAAEGGATQNLAALALKSKAPVSQWGPAGSPPMSSDRSAHQTDGCVINTQTYTRLDHMDEDRGYRDPPADPFKAGWGLLK